MVNIDTVYQTVLALANKEQRGYITPQEFNLFAEQSQIEIIEQYFYDINQFNRAPNNSKEYSNMIALIDEKLGEFKVLNVMRPLIANATSMYSLPNNLYKLGSVYTSDLVVAEETSLAEVRSLQLSPLTTPTTNTPMYTLSNSDALSKRVTLYPAHTGRLRIDYIRHPQPPRWGFTIVGERAMANPDRTTHFELHASESSELVYRILLLAGITINKQEVSGAATALQNSKIQQEKQ